MTVLALPPGLSSRFTAQSQLHRGRAGVAYRARTVDGAEGVLRLLDPSLSRSAPDRVRISRELQKLATVVHPGLAVPSEMGEDGGQLWYFRPFVEGESLADCMARGPMPVDQVLNVGGQIADALHALHRAGLLHRDVCPERVVLGADGRVVLVDAVVAAAIDEEHDRIFGTASFVSPEEVEGKPISFRSDLYSLGMLVYSALTGEPPFEGPTATVLQAQLRDVPPPLAVELNPEARSLLDQLLDKEPRCRPFSAQKVAKTLSPYVPLALRPVDKVAGVPSATPPPSRTPKATLLGVPAMTPPPSAAPAPTAAPAAEPVTAQPSATDSAWVPTRTLMGMRAPDGHESALPTEEATRRLQPEPGAEAIEGRAAVAVDATEPVSVDQVAEEEPTRNPAPRWPWETSSWDEMSTQVVQPASHAGVPITDHLATTVSASSTESDEFPLSVGDLEDPDGDELSPVVPTLRVSSAPLAAADSSATDPFSATLTAPLPRRSLPPPVPPGSSAPPQRTSAPPLLDTLTAVASLPSTGAAPGGEGSSLAPLSVAPPALAPISVAPPAPPSPAPPSLAPPSVSPATPVEPTFAQPPSSGSRKGSPLKLALIAAALLLTALACVIGSWLFYRNRDHLAGSPPVVPVETVTPTATAPTLDAGSSAPQVLDLGQPNVGAADAGAPDQAAPDLGVADLGPTPSSEADEFTADELRFMRGPRPRDRAERTRWLALRRTAAASSMMNAAPSSASAPSATARLQERARAATAAGNHAEATQLYEQLTRSSPSNASAWFALGQSRMRQRNGRGAAAALQTATSLSPRNATYWAMLGAARRNSGDASGARAAFQQALRIDPNNQTAQRGLAP